MKTVNTLIRLAKREVDELTRTLADIEGERARAAQRIIDLDARVSNEQDVAARNAIAGALYGAYAMSARDDRLALIADQERCDREAQHVRALLEAAYAELKKIEKLAEWRNERRAAENAKIERAALDETAIIRAARTT